MEAKLTPSNVTQIIDIGYEDIRETTTQTKGYTVYHEPASTFAATRTSMPFAVYIFYLCKGYAMNGYLIYHPRRDLSKFGDIRVYHDWIKRGNRDPYIWNKQFLHRSSIMVYTNLWYDLVYSLSWSTIALTTGNRL